ncbi:MAG TPA: site-specific integrase [Streptosporangiaceae bacterium]
MTGRSRARANGEGSIFPYRNGYAAYVWVITPAGERRRRWAYGKTREEVHDKWVKLQAKAAEGPLPTTTPTVATYLSYWLSDVIEPNREPSTFAQYELMSRCYIVPELGRKRLDRLRVRDVQSWLNKLPGVCQCCAQGKDKRRPESRRRCCAIEECCNQYSSRRTIQDARDTLRAALNNARREEILSRNVAEMVTIPAARKVSRRGRSWTVDEARKFLESAYTDNDPLYALWVLILVLGMRRGEALGLPWAAVDLDTAEISLEWQFQRVGKRLIHKQVLKTDGSTDILPIPPIGVAALQLQKDRQDGMRARDWPDKCICGTMHELVFTTRTGRLIEPRNIKRSFDARCAKAGVRRIRVHDTRRTCGSLLAALDVHPRVAMAILRHAKIAITMEIYTEVPDKVTRAALKRLSDQLGSAITGHTPEGSSANTTSSPSA